MLTGLEVVPLIPAAVGVAAAVNVTAPRFDGRQLQLAEKLELDPVANLFLHPGSTQISATAIPSQTRLTKQPLGALWDVRDSNPRSSHDRPLWYAQNFIVLTWN